ncbi:unnamed protein product [Colias eurytheme]|nr:unnamed protein product [Colias eurytheme]
MKETVQALVEDSVKFESSLAKIEDLLKKQQEEIKKLEQVRDEALSMRIRATAAATAEAARAHDAEHSRAAERAYFAQRFEERRREMEKLEKRIFPPALRPVRQDSTGSMDGEPAVEEISPDQEMEEIFQRLMKLTGVTEPEQVFDRFRAQRETSSRLNYLQQSIEDEKLQLERAQTTLMAELEGYKFASVKDKDEGQDEIMNLKTAIKEEEESYDTLKKELEELESFLLDIKKLLYDLCKFLEPVVPEPPTPEWTAEARDVQETIRVVAVRLERARDKHNTLIERPRDGVAMPSNPTSVAPSVAASAPSHSTQRDSDRIAPAYRDLAQREPGKPPVSDEEEDIPSRCYLKRQAQLIIDTKCRRKGFRPPYPRR